MLTDAILKDATAEAERFLLSIVPEDGEPHVFSKRFERKMQKLIRRANHPIRYQILRAAAAIVLAIATLFGAVMAVSPEARAAIENWYKKAFGIYTHYTSSGNVQDETKYTYRLSEIPAGYREWEVVEQTNGKCYYYHNDAGHILRFSYTYAADGNVFIETKNCDRYDGMVNNSLADIHISRNKNEASVILWQDAETGTLLQISARATVDELIALAESVKK